MKGDEEKKREKETGQFVKKSDIQLNVSALKGELEQFKCGPIKIECALRAGDVYVSRSRLAGRMEAFACADI